MSSCDHLSDAELVARFEAATLPASDYHHREHVRIAFAMLHHSDLPEAALRFRRALRHYAAAINAAARYHETLTWAYLVLIAGHLADARYPDSLAFIAAHPALLDHHNGALARHYDVAAITASPLARRVFVLPERAP